MTMTGGGSGYWLNGCPNYSPGNTSKNITTCPAVPVAPGSYKFSILGMLYGSMINSAHNESYGVRCRGLPDYQVPHWRDLAQYKSLVMTSTLDITNVGENTTVRSAWVEWRNGATVDFTRTSGIPPTTPGHQAALRPAPGSGEDEIVLKFAPYCSTHGKYERDVAAVKEEFRNTLPVSGPLSNLLELLRPRDITGYEGGSKAKPSDVKLKSWATADSPHCHSACKQKQLLQCDFNTGNPQKKAHVIREARRKLVTEVRR